MRLIAFVLLLPVLPVLAACNSRAADEAPMRRADGSLVSASGGDVSLSDGSSLHFVITSERYKQWEAARSGLTRPVVARFGALLKPKSPTQQSISRATAFLESDAQAKQSIERSGMSVRDFVLMTVALEQEMQLAANRGGQAPEANAYPIDSAYALPNVPPAQIPPGAYLAPAYDSMPHRDTVARAQPRLPPARVDSTYRRDSVRVDTPAPRRDTVIPKRDTVTPKRDSTPPPIKPVTDSLSRS